jgi:hypothetical protein
MPLDDDARSMFVHLSLHRAITFWSFLVSERFRQPIQADLPREHVSTKGMK